MVVVGLQSALRDNYNIIPLPHTTTHTPIDRVDYVATSIHKSLLILPVTVFFRKEEYFGATSEAMLDTDASGNLISLELVDLLELPITMFEPGNEIKYYLADDTVYTSRATVTIHLKLHNTQHKETITLRILETSSFPIILGLSWFQLHNPN